MTKPTLFLYCNPAIGTLEINRGAFVAGFEHTLYIRNLSGVWATGDYVLSIRQQLQGNALAYGELTDTDNDIQTWTLHLRDALAAVDGQEFADFWLQLVDVNGNELSYSPPLSVQVHNTAFASGESPPIPGPEPVDIENGQSVLWNAAESKWNFYYPVAEAEEDDNFYMRRNKAWAIPDELYGGDI